MTHGVVLSAMQLQGIVAELKAGFSRALLELSHIQHGDSRLQSQLQETQSCCHKRALHLEALVQSLRVTLQTVPNKNKVPTRAFYSTTSNTLLLNM